MASFMGFPGGSDGKESTCNAGDLNSIPGLGRSHREGNGNPLQYSCLEKSTDRRAWRVTVHGVRKSQTRLSMHALLRNVGYFSKYDNSIDTQGPATLLQTTPTPSCWRNRAGVCALPGPLWVHCRNLRL